MTRYTLNIDYDPDTERPGEFGIARMVSFNSRHINYEHPDEWLSIQDGGTVHTHPNVLATLSYYEHGNCRWMVGESVIPDHGGFDTVNVAGVIVWGGLDEEREWWIALGDDERRTMLDGIAEEYTLWSNGDTYMYSLQQLSLIHDCPNCGGHSEPDDIEDSCGGFIGIDHLLDELRGVIDHYGIDPGDIDLIGKYELVTTDDLRTKVTT